MQKRVLFLRRLGYRASRPASNHTRFSTNVWCCKPLEGASCRSRKYSERTPSCKHASFVRKGLFLFTAFLLRKGKEKIELHEAQMITHCLESLLVESKRHDARRCCKKVRRLQRPVISGHLSFLLSSARCQLQKSEEMMRGRTAKEYENYGELLYVEGKIKAEQRRKLVEARKLEEQQKEVQGLTLKPEIRWELFYASGHVLCFQVQSGAGKLPGFMLDKKERVEYRCSAKMGYLPSSFDWANRMNLSSKLVLLCEQSLKAAGNEVCKDPWGNSLRHSYFPRFEEQRICKDQIPQKSLVLAPSGVVLRSELSTASITLLFLCL